MNNLLNTIRTAITDTRRDGNNVNFVYINPLNAHELVEQAANVFCAVDDLNPEPVMPAGQQIIGRVQNAWIVTSYQEQELGFSMSADIVEDDMSRMFAAAHTTIV